MMLDKTLQQGDYQAAFSDEISYIIDQNIQDRTKRIDVLRELIDSYVVNLENKPNGKQLEQLTDHILKEELTDPNPYKISHNMYPFMSDSQFDLRRNRETSLKIAEETGTDGCNYRLPKRRQRTKYDNQYVDMIAKGRNQARQQQYQQDTSVGIIQSYNLKDTGGAFTNEFVKCLEHGMNENYT